MWSLDHQYLYKTKCHRDDNKNLDDVILDGGVDATLVIIFHQNPQFGNRTLSERFLALRTCITAGVPLVGERTLEFDGKAQ
jgi:hypothetical protein